MSKAGAEGKSKLLTLSLKTLNASKRTLRKEKKVLEIPKVLMTRLFDFSYKEANKLLSKHSTPPPAQGILLLLKPSYASHQ